MCLGKIINRKKNLAGVHARLGALRADLCCGVKSEESSKYLCLVLLTHPPSCHSHRSMEGLQDCQPQRWIIVFLLGRGREREREGGEKISSEGPL